MRNAVRDRPTSLCKISAKYVQQFRKRFVPDRQTDRQTDSKFNVRVISSTQAASTSTSTVNLKESQTRTNL